MVSIFTIASNKIVTLLVVCPARMPTSGSHRAPTRPILSWPSTVMVQLRRLPSHSKGIIAALSTWPEFKTQVVSESDGFAEQQDGAASGVGFCVEDEKVVDGAGLPVDRLGAGAFQREGVVFDAAQRGAQVGYHLLCPDDPDPAGGAAGVGGQFASGARGGHDGAGFGERGHAAHGDVRAGPRPPPPRPPPPRRAGP